MILAVPRLINFSEKIQLSFEKRSAQIPEEISDLALTYRQFINSMRDRCCENNKYWTFDLNLVSADDVQMWCESDVDTVVSQQWRLIGSFEDLISLAKLAGYVYQPQGREITLPEFGPEESYWIRSLQLIKLCQNKTLDPDAVSSCTQAYFDKLSENTPLLWKTESQFKKLRLCHCCSDQPKHRRNFQPLNIEEPPRPLSPIELVKVEPITITLQSPQKTKTEIEIESHKLSSQVGSLFEQFPINLAETKSVNEVESCILSPQANIPSLEKYSVKLNETISVANANSRSESTPTSHRTPLPGILSSSL